MKILATDLDRTLLPNGHWPADVQAIDLFNRLTEDNDVMVVYVTGRNLALTEGAIQEFGIRHPHVLIGDVGTSIRRYEQGEWHDYPGWDTLIRHRSPRWQAETVRAAVTGIDGLVEQAREHCGPFKQSYYVDHGDRERILRQVDDRIRGSHSEVIIYSYDSQADTGLLDLLPDSATKQTALEFLADEMGIDKSGVVFCGDSGNDVFPLTAGFSGVMVRNADEQLVADVTTAMQENPDLRVYHASGFKDLSGYYTSGVIEGAYHYGLFSDDH
jgi:sucrose-6F-phosphate phosphohydrolase